MLDVRTILCPTDMSEPSRAAFRLACSLGREHGARLVVLHAYPPPTGDEVADAARGPYSERDLIDTLRAQAGQHLGVVVDFRIVEGDPGEEILRAARGCDMVVMGTHGRTGFRRAVLGSVAERVVRKAPCPVVTVRPEARVPPESAPAAPARSGEAAELGAGD